VSLTRSGDISMMLPSEAHLLASSSSAANRSGRRSSSYCPADYPLHALNRYSRSEIDGVHDRSKFSNIIHSVGVASRVVCVDIQSDDCVAE